MRPATYKTAPHGPHGGHGQCAAPPVAWAIRYANEDVKMVSLETLVVMMILTMSGHFAMNGTALQVRRNHDVIFCCFFGPYFNQTIFIPFLPVRRKQKYVVPKTGSGGIAKFLTLMG